jgi:putative flavoprotein involved in K+ transport
MVRQVETIIVGGGQAGLATSYYLTQRGHENLVLEQAAQAANAWRNYRWDSFTLLTPNWALKMPGAEYRGPDPDGFLPRDQVVAYFEQYIDRFQVPVQFNTRVAAVERQTAGLRYRVTTDDTIYEAANVVIAAGLYQRPKRTVAHGVPASIVQFHSSAYRNPQALPPGAILVVGSAQSGCQIAEELYQSGRRVYLSVGTSGRVPRRYRGKDSFEWLDLIHFFDRTPDKLSSHTAKFGANPQVSGKDGGHSVNLHQFVRDGVTLLGHVRGAEDGVLNIAADLKESLAKTDKLEADLLAQIDRFIALSGLAAPPETMPNWRAGYEVDEILALDLKAAGISTIIWAVGYQFDFNWVKLPVFDEDGFPIQQRGVTAQPGLYFIGLPWLHKFKSGLLMGVGDDAQYLAEQLAA